MPLLKTQAGTPLEAVHFKIADSLYDRLAAEDFAVIDKETAQHFIAEWKAAIRRRCAHPFAETPRIVRKKKQRRLPPGPYTAAASCSAASRAPAPPESSSVASSSPSALPPPLPTPPSSSAASAASASCPSTSSAVSSSSSSCDPPSTSSSPSSSSLSEPRSSSAPFTVGASQEKGGAPSSAGDDDAAEDEFLDANVDQALPAFPTAAEIAAATEAARAAGRFAATAALPDAGATAAAVRSPRSTEAAGPAATSAEAAPAPLVTRGDKDEETAAAEGRAAARDGTPAARDGAPPRQDGAAAGRDSAAAGDGKPEDEQKKKAETQDEVEKQRDALGVYLCEEEVSLLREAALPPPPLGDLNDFTYEEPVEDFIIGTFDKVTRPAETAKRLCDGRPACWTLLLSNGFMKVMGQEFLFDRLEAEVTEV